MASEVRTVHREGVKVAGVVACQSCGERRMCWDVTLPAWLLSARCCILCLTMAYQIIGAVVVAENGADIITREV